MATGGNPEIPACDALRDPSVALEPDTRIGRWALEHQHAVVAQYVLNATVPQGVRVHFETAKNLYLYAWFVYRFYPVAEQYALTSLEYCLKEKLSAEIGGDQQQKLPQGLSALLKRALDRGLIRNENLKCRVEWATRRAKDRYLSEQMKEMDRTGATEMIFDDSDVVPTAEDLEEDWLGRFIKFLPMIRNEYAHGSDDLYPTVQRTIGIACELMNQLYPVKAE